MIWKMPCNNLYLDITVLLYWTNMREITSYWFEVLREITSYWFDVQKRANFKQLFCATCRFPHSYLTYYHHVYWVLLPCLLSIITMFIEYYYTVYLEGLFSIITMFIEYYYHVISNSYVVLRADSLTVIWPTCSLPRE
jgi:hypothetical protein